jgi:hypothetical protein
MAILKPIYARLAGGVDTFWPMSGITSEREPEAVLVTGVYGAGKTSIAEEIADVLEERGVPYAAIDLDWLGWFDAGWDDDVAEYEVMLRNLNDVVANYRSAGIRSFVLAFSIETSAELNSIRATLGMPVLTVRLDVDLATITKRLESDITTARQVDLHWSGVWLSEGRGVGLEDFVVPNDRPIRVVAMEILGLIGWD